MDQRLVVSLGQRALEFVEKAGRAEDLASLGELFQDEIAHFGFSTFACGSPRLLRNSDLDRMYLQTWPEDWIKVYVHENFLEHDILPQETVRRAHPFTWQEVKEQRGRLAPRERRVMGAAADSGWPHGFVVPIHGPGGDFALVSMGGTNGDLAPAERAALQLMCLTLHQRARELWEREHGFTRPQIPPLTDREREILAWVAAGKTDWEISQILAISTATVQTHLERVRRKLGASTRAQAAALGVWLGLIRP